MWTLAQSANSNMKQDGTNKDHKVGKKYGGATGGAKPKRPENWNYKKSEEAKPRHTPDFKYRETGDSFFSTQVHPMGHNPPEDNIFGGTKN